MSIPLIPWEPHCFPTEIQQELVRRSINRSMKYIKPENGDWGGFGDEEWMEYRGPMTAWVRVCSNSDGLDIINRPTFVMYGGRDFATSYGFNRGIFGLTTGANSTEPNATVLGYTANGDPHYLVNDVHVSSDSPLHVPNPEIEKVSAVIQKELLRRVRIEWTCFSPAQLAYMTPYFLIPGITMTVEWGWNHFNPSSLLDLRDTEKLTKLYNDPYPLYTENVLQSHGNYEVVFGFVTNFEWSIDGNKIKCMTEVTSKDRLYAGIPLRANMIEADRALSDKDQQTSAGKAKGDTQKSLGVVDNFKKVVLDYVDTFKDMIDPSKATADEAINAYMTGPGYRPLRGFINWLKQKRPDDYKEYLFGIYYGREETTSKRYIAGGFAGLQESTVKSVDDVYANKDYDFDCQTPRKHLWLNMGLIIELLNFCSQLKGVDNKPMFQVDIHDTIITGHPNLISTDGKALLIPNSLSPKYFTGVYGAETYDGNTQYEKEMQPCTNTYPLVQAQELDNPNEIRSSLKWSNYRLRQLFVPSGKIRRDDISVIINAYRYKYADPQGDYEFPFSGDYYVEEGNELRKYEAYYTGFLKNLYVHVDVLKDTVLNPNVVFFDDIVKKILEKINDASGQFWKFRLDAGAGRLNTAGYASMKIVDDNMTQYTSNEGKIFTFDYYSAEGLLQSINFRPTLSNAQAIRTIYAQSNLTNKRKVVLSGDNQLLDYKFSDRILRIGDESGNTEDKSVFTENSWKSSMAKLQTIRPPEGVFQVTSKNGDGEKTIYRLTLPPGSDEVLNLMLEDNDKGHNPRYTGIMPGIQAEFTIQGIAGIRTFAMFRVRGLPEPYSEKNVVFRVVNCNDSIQNGNWVTTLVAGVIPLRGYFASKLGLDPKVDVAPIKK